MQEIWSKLGIKSTMSTAFHPQTDGETECVNQELEQYLCIFCNFQVDNWAELLPFMEFAHNARAHAIALQTTLRSKSGMATNWNSFPL